jgi:hypothetical protein
MLKVGLACVSSTSRARSLWSIFLPRFSLTLVTILSSLLGFAKIALALAFYADRVALGAMGAYLMAYGHAHLHHS